MRNKSSLSSFSRRSFMQAAAVVAAAPFVRAGVPATPSGKPLGIGFIGMGKQSDL